MMISTDGHEKATFVGELVTTAKQLLQDTDKLVETLSQGFTEVQQKSGGAIKQTLLFTVGTFVILSVTNKFSCN